MPPNSLLHIRLGRVIITSVMLLLFASLTSCTEQSDLESAMRDYKSRLGKVLATEFPSNKSENWVKLMPSKASLKTDIPNIEINLREFYALKYCEFAGIVAQRNSALGKAQLPSQRFIYEFKLLQSFSSCINKIQDEQPQLSKKLAELRVIKQQHYPLAWRRLIQESQETYSALSSSKELINTQSYAKYQQALAEWSTLINLQQLPSVESTIVGIETSLQQIHRTALPAALWKTQHEMSNQLDTLNQVLKLKLPQITCDTPESKEQAKILQNIFRLFFVQKLQPIGSKVNELHYAFTPLFNKLIQSPLSIELKNHIAQQSNEQFTTYQTSTKDHIKLWQSFFNKCNL